MSEMPRPVFPLRAGEATVPMEEICLTHGAHEPDRPGDFRACLECRHMFRTEAELVEAENALRRGWPVPLVAKAADVYSCPHCTHDW